MTDSEREPRINVAAGLAWSALVLAAMIAASIWAWDVIPDGARVPTHWNARGEINGYWSKGNALAFAPFVAAVITLIFAVIPFVEPRRQNLMRGRALYHTLWAAMMIVFAAAHAQIITAAVGIRLPVTSLVIPAIGLLFVFVGNLLGKARPNFTMGVRTPWTLSSDYAWEKTHRWTGRLWVLTGLATIAAAVLGEPPAPIAILLGGVALSAVVALVGSYLFWRADPARER